MCIEIRSNTSLGIYFAFSLCFFRCFFFVCFFFFFFFLVIFLVFLSVKFFVIVLGSSELSSWILFARQLFRSYKYLDLYSYDITIYKYTYKYLVYHCSGLTVWQFHYSLSWYIYTLTRLYTLHSSSRNLQVIYFLLIFPKNEKKKPKKHEKMNIHWGKKKVGLHGVKFEYVFKQKKIIWSNVPSMYIYICISRFAYYYPTYMPRYINHHH